MNVSASQVPYGNQIAEAEVLLCRIIHAELLQVDFGALIQNLSHQEQLLLNCY